MDSSLPSDAQQVLPAFPSRASATAHSLSAPTQNGFFGLTQLHDFTHNQVDTWASQYTNRTLILDFSGVHIWDIAALLWLVVALHHYRHTVGLSFLLRLPEPRADDTPKNRKLAARSADYLRRWRFDEALTNIVPLVDELLVASQRGYFARSAPSLYYRAFEIQDERGLLQSLVSRRLVEIRNLADPASTGPTAITADRIADCVATFQSERLGDILQAQCGIEKRKGDLFSDHLLTEALINVQEHPQATIGMISLSVLGASKELILAIVDNGDSIPATIFSQFCEYNPSFSDGQSPASTTYSEALLSISQRAEVTDFATLPGMSSKRPVGPANVGMGLTYIKNDTVETFGGRLRIVTDSASIQYSPGEEKPQHDHWPHAWPGNLIRIAIPIRAQ